MYNPENIITSARFGNAEKNKKQIAPLITNILMPVYESAEKAALYDDASILIIGESGTGKELIARHILQHSPRKDRPYVEINIGRNTGDLINSDLFGHVKGSYTGATGNRDGFFSKANLGTIFLDEIGDAPMDVQINLLRIIQEGTFYPVGSDETKEINVRIISATNADLNTKKLNGTFRKDLYYRISDYEITLPSLREYPKTELKEITEYLLSSTAQKLNLRIPSIKTDAWEVLLNYKYNGNFRELHQIIKRIFISQKTDINSSDLMDMIRNQKLTKSKTMKEIKEQEVFYALKRNGFNKNKTANELAITVTTLNNILKKSDNKN